MNSSYLKHQLFHFFRLNVQPFPVTGQLCKDKSPYLHLKCVFKWSWEKDAIEVCLMSVSFRPWNLIIVINDLQGSRRGSIWLRETLPFSFRESSTTFTYKNLTNTSIGSNRWCSWPKTVIILGWVKFVYVKVIDDPWKEKGGVEYTLTNPPWMSLITTFKWRWESFLRY